MSDPASEPLRVDVLLHRLCLTKSRSEAKAACESGADCCGGFCREIDLYRVLKDEKIHDQPF